MWFKQLSFFPIQSALTESDLTRHLESLPFQPVSGLDLFSEGFSKPTPFSPDFVFSADQSLCFALHREERVLPASAIKDALDKKVQIIQDTEARKVGRKERMELKEQVIDTLLPRALTKSRTTHGVLRGDWLLVNDANANKAEHLLTKLREACGGFQARLPNTVQSPSSLMTEWLLTSSPQGNFELGDSVVLVGTGDVKPTVKITKKDLTDPNVIEHAQSGMYVKEMELVWNEQVSFTLTDTFALKRIKFFDVMAEKASEQSDDAATLWYAQQVISSETLIQIIDELVVLLGGYLQSE